MVDTDERQIFVENIIRSKKIQTFEQILKQVSCSEATLRRDIRRIRGITSFTHQGRFVTLKDIPKFDKMVFGFIVRLALQNIETVLN